ncbi:MAG: class I SAM-dependent methyltransferase [Pseudomonadota bacterium]
MLKSYERELIDRGIAAADSTTYQQNKIWSRHTNEKADVADSLSKVIRSINKTVPLSLPLRALALGCSDEPQFRILEAAFKGGLYLFDIDETALAVVDRRIKRQLIEGVTTVVGDYATSFATPRDAKRTLDKRLGGERFDLITLHHSLYYSDKSTWAPLMENLYKGLLAPKGALHLALMSSTPRPGTTTWLYNHFADRFFGHRNDQDLLAFRDVLAESPALSDAQLASRTSEVQFFVDDFEQYMAVVWMIMLYPHVHNYSLDQRREITTFVLENFWWSKRPLVQVQDYLAVYKDVRGGVLV